MSKNRGDQFHIDCGERLLAILEEALRRNGRLLPATAEQVDSERSPATLDVRNDRTPDWYDDPFAVIERGRQLIAQPPVLTAGAATLSTATSALALAARNGKPITQEVRKTMDADRRRSESV
jgi:hypothetical protein